jgi:hypothetical protein
MSLPCQMIRRFEQFGTFFLSQLLFYIHTHGQLVTGTRVTTLGEFMTIGDYLLWAVVLKNTKICATFPR